MYNSVEKWERVGTLQIRTMIGNFKNKLDDKARLTIPAKFRDDLGNSIVISAGFDKTLEIRTSKAFDVWMESLTSKGNLSSNARNLQRMILGNSFEVSLDKAGRALLPKQLIELIGLTKEVVLVGVGDKVEVHSEKVWDSIISDGDKLAKSLEQMADELAKEFN